MARVDGYRQTRRPLPLPGTPVRKRCTGDRLFGRKHRGVGDGRGLLGQRRSYHAGKQDQGPNQEAWDPNRPHGCHALHPSHFSIARPPPPAKKRRGYTGRCIQVTTPVAMARAMPSWRVPLARSYASLVLEIKTASTRTLGILARSRPPLSNRSTAMTGMSSAPSASFMTKLNARSFSFSPQKVWA
jgi:hypothetical protein